MDQDLRRAEEFVSALSDDADLQSKLAAATTPEARRAVVEAAGFADVSPEAIKKLAVAKKAESGELSDEELSAAAGAGGVHVAVPVFGDLDVDW